MSKVDLYSLGLKPQYTFEYLVVGPHNQMAAAAAQEVSKKPGETYNPLFIFGPAGIGKTHLIQAVAQSMLAANENLKVKYISAERFASEVIAAISDDNVMGVRQHYSDLDLLIVDDIQFLAESKASQSEFFHIFNNLHEHNHQIIMAADRSPNQLTILDQTIRSRLEWGLAVDVKVPDVQARIQILKLKQEVQGLSLQDDIIVYAAQSLQSNVRELEGFLKRLHAYVTLSHQDLTMDLVHQVIREVMPTSALLQQAAGAETRPMPVAPAPAVSHPQHVVPPPAPPTKVEPVKKKEGGGQNGNQFGVIPPDQPPIPQPVTETVITGRPESKKSDTNEKPEKKPIGQPEPSVPPVSAKPPVPFPTAVVIPETAPEEFVEVDETIAGHKEIGAVFFYPEGKEKELELVHKKFQEVIKKHKLKFRLKKVYGHAYQCKAKINYSSFVDVCKENKVPVAIVIGPPPDALLPEQDFYDLLSVTLDVQGVSLQLVNWAEVDKDYRYLNLALDIALVRSR